MTKFYTIPINVIGKQVETLHHEWQSMFQQLLERQPTVLVFDDLDLLTSCPQNDQDDSLQGESWYYKRLDFFRIFTIL